VDWIRNGRYEELDLIGFPAQHAKIVLQFLETGLFIGGASGDVFSA
jgi:hypothetical protein